MSYRFNRSFLLVAVPVSALLFWLVLYPNVYVLWQSFTRAGEATLANYREFFNSSAQREALINSLLISLGSVVLSALIGVPLALIFTRFDFPGRQLFAALASLPVLLPPLVGVVAFLFLFGESGILTRSVQELLQLSEPPWTLKGMQAILWVHAYTMYVYFYLFASAALKRLDYTLHDAAHSLGASRFKTFVTVTLPLLTPALVGASLLTFMTSMASFSAPYIFGGGIRVLALQIYNSKLNGDLEMALVETVVLMSVSLLFLFLLQRYEGTGKYRSLGKGSDYRRREIEGKFRRSLAGAIGVALVIFLLLPHLTLILISFSQDGTWTTEILPPHYTTENYQRLFADESFLRPISNSLKMASLATAANFIFAFAAAALLVRKRFPGRTLLNSLVILPWALPGTVLALNLATTFNQHDPLQGRLLLVGTFWILPLAYFIRNIPVVVRGLMTGFEQLNPELEEASRSLGARWFYGFRRIVLPLVLPAALAGSSLAFVTALGEFVSSIVIYTIDNRPISVEILSQLRQFHFGSAAAYGVLLVVMIGGVFVLSEKFLGENRRPVLN